MRDSKGSILHLKLQLRHSAACGEEAIESDFCTQCAVNLEYFAVAHSYSGWVSGR